MRVTMMNLPPGLQFLIKVTPTLIVPSILVYFTTAYLLPLLTDSTLPAYVPLLLAALTVPAQLPVRHYLGEARNRRSAAAAGAVLPPSIDGGFMGFDNLKTLSKFTTSYPGEVLNPFHERLGNTCYMVLPGAEMIFTTEPEHIKVNSLHTSILVWLIFALLAILATQFNEFEKGPVFYHTAKSLLGDGVFSTDGDIWKFHRQATRPYFSKDRISHFDIFDRHASEAISLIKVRLTEGHPIDMQDVTARFTLDSATEFLFGHDVQSLSAGLPYPESSGIPNSAHFSNYPSNVFVSSFTEGQQLLSQRFLQGPLWPLGEFWKDKIKPHKEVIDQYIATVMDNVKEKRKQKASTSDESTLLEHLIDFTEDPELLRDEIINLLVAGRDTTSSLTTFAVYAMTQYPEVARRLRQEVNDTIGLERRPTFDDIKGMKYLRAFLNETLRLYPVVPFNGRTSVKATIWASKVPDQPDLFIPKNTICNYSVFGMHRRTDLWGPTALEFDPDRFIDDRLKYLTSNPFIFLPFNAGPRICLGQQFAYNESSYFLIRLLQSFDVYEFAEDAQPVASLPLEEWKGNPGVQGRDKIWPAFHLTMYIKGGMWVRMKSVDSQ